MFFKGRYIDPYKLWGNYIDVPDRPSSDAFMPKVECPNPEHDTVKRHFQVNLMKPYVHCFADCGISGSYGHAVCVLEGFYEKLAVDVELAKSSFDKKPRERSEKERRNLRLYFRAHKLADKQIFIKSLAKPVKNSRVKKKAATPRPKVIKASQLHYDSFIPEEGLEFMARKYGIDGHSIAKWEIGWHPVEQRIVLPANDGRGKLRFLVKRATRSDQWPKYLYTDGYPKTSLLFGACAIDLGMIRSVGLALVEGSFDTVVLHQHGLPIAGGILGTGISNEQVAIIARLRPRRIFHFFDRDSAGVKNIQIAAPKLRKYPQFVCRYPPGKFDPAELTKAEAHRCIERAVPLFKFTRSLNVNNKQRERAISLG